ncbi:Bug family tripartite tricarboxylate transporter substrate binding protein [Falsirhodobacter halotolerans]|uniref:Bug family tripartite tricarboxylate transporter substrate binding protein n=1 Tax=Falsirhodobacter halotolerans TaxID=1146892 RepID=UPI001FD3EC39|nr:tripartite tricarboxylate transporter substrate binding protein [Falsirhodobacter halotolerans]MCJ8139881.1 tripartite tricarboxylate transporter substrate binding protein [Falsirhodobacter halotolerans]
MNKIKTVAVLGLSALLALPAAAQDYPSGNIDMIVPYPPGGGTDIPARLISEWLTRDRGWNFVVLNQPGAAGTIGLDQLARSDADGYTIGIGQTANMAINPAMNAEVEYDPLTDFTPIIPIVTQPVGIIVPNNSPFEDFGDIVDAARADPGGLLYGTPGQGTGGHLAIERLMQQGDLDFEQIPYSGIAQAISDVMGGVVDFYVGSLPSVLPHANSGSVRLLAVSSAEPFPIIPDVPTIASFGFEGYEAQDWKAVVGPAGMPEESVEALNSAINEALKDPALVANFESQGSVVMGGSSEDFKAFLASEVETWSEVVDAAGLTAQR